MRISNLANDGYLIKWNSSRGRRTTKSPLVRSSVGVQKFWMHARSIKIRWLRRSCSNRGSVRCRTENIKYKAWLNFSNMRHKQPCRAEGETPEGTSYAPALQKLRHSRTRRRFCSASPFGPTEERTRLTPPSAGDPRTTLSVPGDSVGGMAAWDPIAGEVKLNRKPTGSLENPWRRAKRERLERSNPYQGFGG